MRYSQSGSYLQLLRSCALLIMSCIVSGARSAAITLLPSSSSACTASVACEWRGMVLLGLECACEPPDNSDAAQSAEIEDDYTNTVIAVTKSSTARQLSIILIERMSECMKVVSYITIMDFSCRWKTDKQMKPGPTSLTLGIFCDRCGHSIGLNYCLTNTRIHSTKPKSAIVIILM